MTPIIIDSSALVALMYPEDADHGKAVHLGAAMRQTPTLILIPSIIFAETLNLLGKKFGREVALVAGSRIFDDAGFHVGEVEGTVMHAALARWSTQSGGASYTDCYVMACADHYHTKVIFGFDAVFTKNGYHLPVAAKGRKAA